MSPAQRAILLRLFRFTHGISFPYGTSTASTGPWTGTAVSERRSRSATLSGLCFMASDSSFIYSLGAKSQSLTIHPTSQWEDGNHAECATVGILPRGLTVRGKEDRAAKPGGWGGEQPSDSKLQPAQHPNRWAGGGEVTGAQRAGRGRRLAGPSSGRGASVGCGRGRGLTDSAPSSPSPPRGRADAPGLGPSPAGEQGVLSRHL